MIQSDLKKFNLYVPSELGSQQAYASTDDDGIPYVEIAFRPGKEDIDAFLRGDVVYIRSHGPIVVPLSIYTKDKNGKLNL
jgi:hypothetical protein